MADGIPHEQVKVETLRAMNATLTELRADLAQARERIAELEATVANAWADIDTLVAQAVDRDGPGLTADELLAKYHPHFHREPVPGCLRCEP